MRRADGRRAPAAPAPRFHQALDGGGPLPVHEGSSEPGPPWPLTRAQVEAFATDGVAVTGIELVADTRLSTHHRWRAEFHRPR